MSSKIGARESKSTVRAKSPTKILSQILPRQRRQYVVLVQGSYGVELWWRTPSHITVENVPGFQGEVKIGDVLGVFDCSYEENEQDMEQRRASVSYEIEVTLDGSSSAFFGFKESDRGKFDVYAESLWLMPDGAALATAYELYFMGQNGQWGLPMTLPSRKSSVHNIVLAEVRALTEQGVHPTESNCEIAYLWLKAVSKMANLKIRQDMILSDLRAVKKKRNLISGFEPSISKSSDSQEWFTAAKAGKRFETQAVQAMPDRCFMLDAESKQIRKMQVLGQISQRQGDGSGAVHWIVGETVCVEENILEGDESHVSQSVEQEVHCIPQASQLWRKKFMYKNLTKSLHEYGDCVKV